MEQNLYNKTIIWNGDSICYGNRGIDENERDCWASRIAASNSMIYKNYAVGGGTITEHTKPRADGSPRHSISATVDLMYEEFPNNDYGGNYDQDPFCGALESIFYRATKYWKGKKIGFIVAQKMGIELNNYLNRRAYFDLAIKICIKWGIPYLDLWNVCYLNPHLKWMYDPQMSAEENAASGSFYKDGQHLTAAGYQYTSNVVEAWLKTL